MDDGTQWKFSGRVRVRIRVRVRVRVSVSVWVRVTVRVTVRVRLPRTSCAGAPSAPATRAPA